MRTSPIREWSERRLEDMATPTLNHSSDKSNGRRCASLDYHVRGMASPYGTSPSTIASSSVRSASVTDQACPLHTTLGSFGDLRLLPPPLPLLPTSCLRLSGATPRCNIWQRGSSKAVLLRALAHDVHVPSSLAGTTRVRPETPWALITAQPHDV